MNKNYTIVKKRNKKRMILTFLLGFLTLIGGLSLAYYCWFTPKEKDDKKQENAPKVVSLDFPESSALKDQVIQLEQKIKSRQQECDDVHLDEKTKNLMQKIIIQQTLQKEELEGHLLVLDYIHYLDKEIKATEYKLSSPLALEEKHYLTETKLHQEKELITLNQKKGLFLTQKKLKQILKEILLKLKDENLTSNEKDNFTQEKGKLEKKLADCQQEIHNIVAQIKYKSKIIALTDNIKTETNETLKQLLIEEKDLYQNKLENLS